MVKIVWKMFRGVKVFDIFALFLLHVFMFTSVVYFEFDSDGMGPSSTLSVLKSFIFILN